MLKGRWRNRLVILSVLVLVSAMTVGLFIYRSLPKASAAAAVGGAELAPGQVDQNSGAFVSTIPIEVPSFHGMEPALTLTYSSSSGNGMFGLGWQLVGTSAIERVGAGRGSANLASTDVFLLDGEQLVASTALGGTHMTKRQNFQRITFASSTNTWTVHERNGVKKTYAARFNVGSGTVRWMLSSVVDPHGNTVSYGYWCHGSFECYLNTVSYNGTKITFYRETRPDPIISAVGGKVDTGGFSRMNYRVKTIDVAVSGTRARAYKLSYTASASSGRSLLASVRRFGSNATLDPTGTVDGGSALRAITMSYRSDPLAFTLSSGFKGFCDGSTAWRIGTADVNGDGKADLYCHDFEAGSTKLAIGGGSGGFTAQKPFSSWCKRPATGPTAFGAADFNADGRSDLWCNTSSSSNYRLSDGAGAFTPGWSAATWCNSENVGAAIVGNSSGQHRLWCHATTASTKVSPSSTLYSPCDSASSFGAADFDGDGRAEFWCFRAGTMVGPRVYLADGATNAGAINMPTGSSKWCASGTDFGTADFNGDGRADFYCHNPFANPSTTQVLLSDGTYRFRSQLSLSWCPAYGEFGVGDFNGDGKADLWCRRSGDVWLAITNAAATGFTTTGKVLSGWHQGGDFRADDFNGDGKSDFWMHGHTHGEWWVALTSFDGHPDVLTGLTNELGGQTQVTYKPALAWSIGTVEAGLQKAPASLMTVSRLRVGDGRGLWADTSYSYSGGRWDPVERRFLGFKTVAATDVSGAKSVTYFNVAAGYKANRIARVDRISSGGTLLERSTVLYADSTSGGVYKSLVSRRTHAFCEGANCQTTRTDYVAHDAHGNVTQQYEYGDVAVGGDETTVLTGYRYVADSHQVDRPTSVTTLTGTGTTGARLKRLEFVYNAAGDPTVARTWLNTTNSMVVASMDYDAKGNKVRAVNELGKVTSYEYDSTYHMYPIRECVSANSCGETKCADAAVLCTVRGWNGVFDLPTSYRDANAKTTTWGYDAFGRVRTESRPDGGVTSTTYLSWGDPTKQYVQASDVDGSTDGLWKRTFIDGQGRTIKETSEPNRVVNTVYNAQGQVAKVSNLFAGSAVPQYTAFTYDGLGRQIKATNPDGSSVVTSYHVVVNANDADFAKPRLTETICDELGRCRRTGLDGWGNPRVIQEWLGGAVGKGAQYRSRVTYDRLGRNTGITDSVGNVTTMTWDSLGRKTSMVNPDSGTWAYGYDSGGHLISQKDGAGRVATFEYNDPMGRLTSRVAAGVVQATYLYDQAGHGAGRGRMTSMTDSAGSTSWTYSAVGQIAAMTRNTGGTSFTVKQSFDKIGRPASLTYPDGEAVTYAYGADGCQTSVGGYVTAAVCTPTVAKRTLGNGVVYTENYDPKRMWLASNTASSGTTVLQNESYGYHLDGRMKTKRSADGPDNWNYTYDNLGRLTTADNVGTDAYDSTYTYDQIGRMKSGTGIGAMTYPAVGDGHVHAPTTVGGATNTYDDAGNLTNDGARTYTYNALNQLGSVTLGSTTTSYAYDGLGVRVRDGATSFVELGGKLLYQYNSSSKVGTKFYYHGEQRIASRDVGGAPLYVVANHLGSPHLILDTKKAVVTRVVYSPYGKVLVRAGTAHDVHQLAGDYLDTPTGLYHRGVRDQDAARGWFTTPDPSQFADPTVPQSLNRYSYAAGDPVNNVDHTGKAGDRVGSSGSGGARQAGDSGGSGYKLTGSIDPVKESVTMGVDLGVVSLSNTISPSDGTITRSVDVPISTIGIAKLSGTVEAKFTNGGTEWTETAIGMGASAGIDGFKGSMKSVVAFSFDSEGNLVSNTTVTARVTAMKMLNESWVLYKSDNVNWGGKEDPENGSTTPYDVRSQRDWSLAYSDTELATMGIRHGLASAQLTQGSSFDVWMAGSMWNVSPALDNWGTSIWGYDDWGSDYWSFGSTFSGWGMADFEFGGWH